MKKKFLFFTVSWLSGLLSAEIFISTGEWGGGVPPLTAENSLFLLLGAQEVTLVMVTQLEQVERLHSEICPPPMITHTSGSHQIPSQSQRYKIKKNYQKFTFWNFARNFTHDTPSEVAW